MSIVSLDRFLTLVARSQLIDADRLAQVVAEWKRKATLSELDDAQYCADYMVERELLTIWQCKKLLDGRYRGFFLGKYKLLGHLGSGGMSSVYLAEHVMMQRRVAIKVLPQNRVADSSYLARFHHEAQAAAALDHPNIVRAYDLDSDGKIHYLVMEYVDGRDLHALVCQDGPLDYHAAANYVAQAAAGLEHAHQCGLVHRDIKPANLLVDLKRTVKILDMGLAKFTTATRPAPAFAQEEQVLGTADYLAPEQAVNSQMVDHRADIYGLGCTLYFLLTGHPPFAHGSSLERMTAHQQQLPPSILLDRPDAPPALLALCRRMMEKSPENRYQSAAEVQQALCAWLESEAAQGKVGQAMRITAGHQLPGAGESKANLVSGSATDLARLPPELPRPLNALTDTDPNLHRATVKMPTHSLKSPSESSYQLPPNSEVLPFASRRDSAADPSLLHPLPPPIEFPPVEPPRTSWEATESFAVPDESISHPLGAESPLADIVPHAGARRAQRRSRTQNGLWLLLLVSFVVGTILLALFAQLH